MNDPTVSQRQSCRKVRGQLRTLAAADGGKPARALRSADDAAARSHIDSCRKCSALYRLVRLELGALELSGSDSIRPDAEFFVGLRACLNRGPEPGARTAGADDSWSAAVLGTWKQVLPVMGMLVLLILGATFFVGRGSSERLDLSAVRPSERVLLGDVYEFPRPTSDDVLRTIVEVEEE